MEEYVNCNLCGADCSQPLFIKDDYKVVKCKKCSLVYINPRVGKVQLKGKYAGDYSLGYIDKKVSKRKRAKKIVKRISKFKRKGRFLDVGCSAGFILEAARERGFDPYGVEISPYALRHAREELKLEVFDGYLEDASFADDFFDVVTMYNLLEHVPDPTKLLKEVRRIVKHDGLVEMWTPNIGHWKARRMGKNWQDIISDHLYYFSLETIKKILEKTGFQLYKRQFTLKDGLKVYAVPSRQKLVTTVRE